MMILLETAGGGFKRSLVFKFLHSKTMHTPAASPVCTSLQMYLGDSITRSLPGVQVYPLMFTQYLPAIGK